jgi:hypothetical protein
MYHTLSAYSSIPFFFAIIKFTVYSGRPSCLVTSILFSAFLHLLYDIYSHSFKVWTCFTGNTTGEKTRLKDNANNTSHCRGSNTHDELCSVHWTRQKPKVKLFTHTGSVAKSSLRKMTKYQSKAAKFLYL